MEQLDQLATELLHSRVDVDQRLELVANAQQASLAEVERVLGVKLGEIEATFGLCDAA